MENSMKVPQKIKNRSTYNPEISLLGIYISKGNKIISKRYLYAHVHRSTIYNSQDRKIIMSTDGWMDKENVYTCNKELSRLFFFFLKNVKSFLRKEILPYVIARMNLGEITLGKISQS